MRVEKQLQPVKTALRDLRFVYIDFLSVCVSVSACHVRRYPQRPGVRFSAARVPGGWEPVLGVELWSSGGAETL